MELSKDPPQDLLIKDLLTAKKLVLKIDPYRVQQELVPKINSRSQAWPVRPWLQTLLCDSLQGMASSIRAVIFVAQESEGRWKE